MKCWKKIKGGFQYGNNKKKVLIFKKIGIKGYDVLFPYSDKSASTKSQALKFANKYMKENNKC